MTGLPEVTSLEYTRLGVSQDILFRYNYSMRNQGLLCTKRCGNKGCSYIWHIKTGSIGFFDASYTIYPRFIIGKYTEQYVLRNTKSGVL
jgi:hypothetical protein